MGGAMRSYLGGAPGLTAGMATAEAGCAPLYSDAMASAMAGAGAGRVSGLPMSRCGSSGLPVNLASLGSISGSSFNLAELLRSHSFTQGALAGGVPGAGIPLKEARATNDSNVSLGTFLEKTGGDINEILSEFGVGS